jgi:hypothetical protein
MKARVAPHEAARKAVAPMARLWLWLSIAAALLGIIGSAIALTVPAIYALLKSAFFAQAVAQDVANLVLVSPAWLILAILALRGSLRAYLLWLGVLTFTVYNYVIYTLAVPFGSLFPLWVMVFGLALWALIGGAICADHAAVQTSYRNRTAVEVTAWSLMVVGILFALLWLSEDVPALLSGRTPQSLLDMGVPTNPVHVLDFAFFLPAAFLTGLWLLRRRPFAFTVAPAFIVFIILTGVPILLTPVLQAARREAASRGVVIPIGTLTLLMLALLVWLSSTVQPQKRAG